MRSMTWLFVAFVAQMLAAAAGDVIRTLGPDETTLILPADDPPCEGTLYLNGDGSWEFGVAWDFMGVAPPDYGGFGEGYNATGTVCGIQAHLSTTHSWNPSGLADAFIYDSDGTNPTGVLSVTPGILIENLAIWPEVGAHEIAVVPTEVDGDFFAYLWPDWPMGGAIWYFALDRNGPEGLPRTKVVSGLGFPSGWQHPGPIFMTTIKAMGVGAYVIEEPSPASAPTWGRIKALFAARAR